MTDTVVKSIKEILGEYEQILTSKLGRKPTEKEKREYLKEHGVNIKFKD